MDQVMIERWNEVVGRNDNVYHLGDFALAKKDRIREILSSLNGRIHLIRGNHDGEIKGDLIKEFVWVKDYHEVKILDDQIDTKIPIIMSHYPFETWNKSHWGSWALHGHCHNDLPDRGKRRIDVGVDGHDFRPLSFEDVRDLMEGRTFNPPGKHDDVIG